MQIEELNDYAVIKKLASALWQEDSGYHGAAVMVGAGFSRSAASTGNPEEKMPIWRDISRILSKELGSESTHDALRLAEEYAAYFGRQSLLDALKKTLNDAAWMPGKLHGDLLELPWSEVLTTNWDTLLERASGNLTQRSYSIVSMQEELSSAHSPRIVKLHGTANVTDDLVFTQEDFRRYPQKHAAFVNFARQVFIENELCLLGFSGDDPNFLQWAGWVRDHLAPHARRIYLAGDLGLTAAKRKYLESINISPIDLSALVADFDNPDARHLEATKAFLSLLRNLKPRNAWDWRPQQIHRATMSNEEIDRTHRDGVYAASLLEKQLPTLANDRMTYPGWLICPERQRWDLQVQVNDPYPTIQNLNALSEQNKEALLFEISWRHEITFEAVPNWLCSMIIDLCENKEASVLTKEQKMRMALLLLKNSRWFEDPEFQLIRTRAEGFLQENFKHWPESENELAYFRAIIARDRFEYNVIENMVEKISTNDPVWKLRKASLLSDVGRIREGGLLVAEAYRELLARHRKNRSSIYLVSRLAWAHWMLRAVDLIDIGKDILDYPSFYQDSKSSPLSQLECIRDRVSDAIEKAEKNKAIEPMFEPGSYRDNSKSINFNGKIHPLLLLEGISDSAGMPIRWSNVSLLAEEASKLATLEELRGIHRFSLAIRAASSDTSDVLKRVFSRSELAKLTGKDADYLLISSRNAVMYWSRKLVGSGQDEFRHSIERLRVFMEVLARASIRAAPAQAKEVFRLAIDLGRKVELRHFWLFDSLRHMLDYSIESVPPDQRAELLLDALSFPLESEANLGIHDRWPNPVIESVGERHSDLALDRRIDEIIEHVAPCSERSLPALLRLLPMVKCGFLGENELKKLSENIWGNSQDHKKIPNTGLLVYLLAILPNLDSSMTKEKVHNFLYESSGDMLFSPSFLQNIVAAATNKYEAMLPSPGQAEMLFDKLVLWRPKEKSKDFFGIVGGVEQEVASWIGRAIAECVVPSMAPESLDEERFNKALSFHSEVVSPRILIGLACFAAIDDSFADRVEKSIRRALQSKRSENVASASFAILKWRKLRQYSATDRLVQRLIHLVGSGRLVALPALLWTANELFNEKLLSEPDSDILAEIIPVIFDAANYHAVSPSSEASITVSLIRSACHTLARDILQASTEDNAELRRVVLEASEDVLPEVRFA